MGRPAEKIMPGRPAKQGNAQLGHTQSLRLNARAGCMGCPARLEGGAGRPVACSPVGVLQHLIRFEAMATQRIWRQESWRLRTAPCLSWPLGHRPQGRCQQGASKVEASHGLRLETSCPLFLQTNSSHRRGSTCRSPGPNDDQNGPSYFTLYLGNACEGFAWQHLRLFRIDAVVIGRRCLLQSGSASTVKYRPRPVADSQRAAWLARTKTHETWPFGPVFQTCQVALSMRLIVR